MKVSVDVANTGARAGDEVVQLYIHEQVASITQPVIQLKRFKRVHLEPGARTTVDFELKPEDLAFWNLQMKHVVEPGVFDIYAGPNSADLKKEELTVTP